MESDKLILIRHDVDNSFNIYGCMRPLVKKIKKVANYSILLIRPFIRIVDYIPNFLETIEYVVDIERDYNALATYFFRVPTAPSKKIVKQLLGKGHEIAYHSDRNDSFQNFYSDLKILEKITGIRIYGFTKHGHSPVRDGGPWNEEKFILYGIKAKLKYLAQGSSHPEWQLPKKIGNLWVFGHHITLKKTSLKKAKEYIKTKKLPVILVHPEDLYISGEREKFEEILCMGKCIPFIKLINRLEGKKHET